MEKAIRLDKYLADMGKGTRTELKEMIRKGRIKVNGEVVKNRRQRSGRAKIRSCSTMRRWSTWNWNIIF